MNSDEDTFFEDDKSDEEEDDDFPDVEVVDEEDDDYDPSDVLDELPSERLEKFVNDPWPPTTFALVIIGLAMVLFTPPDLWAIWRYFIIANYFMVIFGGAAITYSLITWHRAGKHRLRWAGMTNLVVIIILLVLSTLDTFSWMITLHSIIPGVDTPIIGLGLVLVIFSIYSLWAIQRNFGTQRR